MSTPTPAAQQRESEKDYNDEPSILSASESDFEDDLVVRLSRSSIEVVDHDRGLLEDEEEREKLLTGGSTRNTSSGFFSTRRKDERLGEDMSKHASRNARRSRKRRKNTKINRHDEDGELIYEMEEGGRISYSSSQASSSSAELDKLNLPHSSMSKVSFMFITRRQ